MAKFWRRALMSLLALAAIASFVPSMAKTTGPLTVSVSSLVTGTNAGDPFYALFSLPKFISGRLGVYFTNTGSDFSFCPGTDNGVYVGSLSVTYNYTHLP